MVSVKNDGMLTVKEHCFADFQGLRERLDDEEFAGAWLDDYEVLPFEYEPRRHPLSVYPQDKETGIHKQSSLVIDTSSCTKNDGCSSTKEDDKWTSASHAPILDRCSFHINGEMNENVVNCSDETILTACTSIKDIRGGPSPSSVLRFCSLSAPPTMRNSSFPFFDDHDEFELAEKDASAYPQAQTKPEYPQNDTSCVTDASGILPPCFKPKPYSVIIGRGKETKGAIGNIRLRVLASRFLPMYSSAPNKAAKSKIVATVMAMIQEACPLGAFIRLGKDGRWYEVKTAVATEKVGYTLRELLGEQYKSSSKTKATIRRSLSIESRAKGAPRPSPILLIDCSEATAEVPESSAPYINEEDVEKQGHDNCQ